MRIDKERILEALRADTLGSRWLRAGLIVFGVLGVSYLAGTLVLAPMLADAAGLDPGSFRPAVVSTTPSRDQKSGAAKRQLAKSGSNSAASSNPLEPAVMISIGPSRASKDAFTEEKPKRRKRRVHTQTEEQRSRAEEEAIRRANNYDPDTDGDRHRDPDDGEPTDHHRTDPDDGNG